MQWKSRWVISSTRFCNVAVSTVSGFPGSYTFRAGNTYTIDATTVLLENQATAALYNYTPHFHGNENFYNLYTQWFTRTFPDGSLVRIGKTGTTWYIQHGERRAILTRAAFLTRFGDYKKFWIFPQTPSRTTRVAQTLDYRTSHWCKPQMVRPTS